MNAETTYHTWELANGLRILAAHQPWAKTFAATLSFRAGWNYESPEQATLTHLVEHLAFSGRNRTLVEAFAEEGGYVNGSTEWENTLLMTAGHKSLLPQAIAIFANALEEIPVDKESLASELTVLEHETLTMQEGPAELEYRQLMGEIAGDPSIARPFPDKIRNLRNLAPDDIRVFAEERFSPANALLVIVSASTAEELGTFHDRLARPARRVDFAPEEPELESAGGNRLLARRQLGPHSLVGVSHVYQPRERFPLAAVAMLNHLIGGGPHSKLFKELRAARPMAYDVGASTTALSRYVMTEAHAVVRKADNLAALEHLVAAYRWLADEALDETSFEKARLNMHRQIDQFEDSPLELCTWLAHEAWMSREPSPKSYQEQLRKLSLDEAKHIAAEAFSPEHRVTVIVGSCGFFKKRRAREILDAGS